MKLRGELSRPVIIAVMAGVFWFGSPAISADAAAKGKRSEPIEAGGPRFGDYLAGRTAQLDHDWRNAGRLMRQAWEADRDDPTLRRQALLLTLAGGDFPAAASIARAVPLDSGDAPLARLVLAVNDIADGHYPQAEELLQSNPPEGVERYLRPLLTAWAEAGRGRKAQARAALDQLGTLPGTSELHDLQSAMMAEMLGDKSGAADLYARLLDGKPSTRALIMSAQFLERQGSPDQARAAIEKLDPDGASASVRVEMLARLGTKGHAGPAPDARSGAAAALFDIAASLAAQEQADLDPLLYVQLALHLAPNFPQAQLLLAEIDQHWGRLEDAIAVLLGVDSASDLRSTAVRDAMADLEKRGQNGEAIKIGRGAMEAHPEDIDLALLNADLLRQAQRYAEAIAAYDATLGRVPPTSNRRGLTLYHRGIAHERAHEWPRAEADLLAALMLRPDDPGLLNYLAFSWADQGINLDRARTMLERAIQLLPDDGAIIDSLGWVMFRQGDFDDAVKQLEHAVELEADDATVNDHLGDAYWRVGRQIEARAQWDRAVRLTDDKSLADQIRAKLKDGLEPAAPRRAAAD